MATESEANANIVTIRAPEGARGVWLQSFDFPPYIIVGEKIVPGQVLCRVTGVHFTEKKIVAARAGKVIAIHVDNGRNIKEGDQLITVELEDVPAQDIVVAGTVSRETASRMRPRETVGCPEEGSETEVRSPLEGVFCSAETPNSSPFVQVGDIVACGQPVCVVETMKVFNVVLYCGKRLARVILIKVKNGQEVKTGQILIRLKPVEDESADGNSAEN